MEWLLQKALEKALESAVRSYPPEKVAEMLDQHQEAIQLLVRFVQYGTIILLIGIGIIAIRAELKYHKFEEKIKILEKNQK